MIAWMKSRSEEKSGRGVGEFGSGEKKSGVGGCYTYKKVDRGV